MRAAMTIRSLKLLLKHLW